MKIEFNPWKILAWFIIDCLYWIPLIFCVIYTLNDFGFTSSNSLVWWVAVILAWQWISWGLKLHKFYEEMSDE